jgi:4-diphosphocytidyl-2-C-methyl-D-erythritol kinase
MNESWSMTVPAKLNWGLKVLGKRADGFHELRGWFLALDLADRLELHPIAEGEAGLEVEGNDGIPTDASNLVLKAEAAWRAAGGEAPPLRWRLVKGVPTAAGLGGGSADAAAALRLLEAASLCPADAALVDLAVSLGSDVPFFLDHAPALRGGRGEELLVNALEAPNRRLLLVAPPFEVATPPVFAALDAPPVTPEEALAYPVALEFPEMPPPNDLLAGVLASHAAFAGFWERLQTLATFHLSGSGGACYLPLEGPAAPDLLAELEGFCALVRETTTRTGPVLGDVQALETS